MSHILYAVNYSPVRVLITDNVHTHTQDDYQRSSEGYLLWPPRENAGGPPGTQGGDGRSTTSKQSNTDLLQYW